MAFSVISAIDGSPALSVARSSSYFMLERSKSPREISYEKKNTVCKPLAMLITSSTSQNQSQNLTTLLFVGSVTADVITSLGQRERELGSENNFHLITNSFFIPLGIHLIAFIAFMISVF